VNRDRRQKKYAKQTIQKFYWSAFAGLANKAALHPKPIGPATARPGVADQSVWRVENRMPPAKVSG
jgi:hypothetical protein